MKSAKAKNWKSTLFSAIDRLVDFVGGASKGISRLFFGLLSKQVSFLSSIFFGAGRQVGKPETAHSFFGMLFWVSVVAACIQLATIIRRLLSLVAVGAGSPYWLPTYFAIAAGINLLQLQPKLWRRDRKAAAAVVNYDPLEEVDEDELRPKDILRMGGELGFRRLQKRSQAAYRLELFIYVLWLAASLKFGASPMLLSGQLFLSLLFLKGPEIALGITGEYASLLNEKDEEEQQPLEIPQRDKLPGAGAPPGKESSRF